MQCSGTTALEVSNPVMTNIKISIKSAFILVRGVIHKTREISMTKDQISARELLLGLWGVIMFILGYGIGNLNQDLVHKLSHHARDGVGVCESAVYCSSFAPRSLCAQWKDELK